MLEYEVRGSYLPDPIRPFLENLDWLMKYLPEVYPFSDDNQPNDKTEATEARNVRPEADVGLDVGLDLAHDLPCLSPSRLRLYSLPALLACQKICSSKSGH